MKPLSNKFNVLLLIIAVGLLVYFLIALLTISKGMGQLVEPIYPLYISIVILVLTMIGIVFSIRARLKWEPRPKS